VQSFAPYDSVQNQLFVHFGLRENPFGGTPDPRFLFHSETHREALASLINGIDFEFGFQMLVAQPGMGKTTLLFNFLERFRASAHTAFLFQPQLEPSELLQSLLSELGESSENSSVRKLSEQLNQFLGRAAAEHKRVIVVVDEAQNLDFTLLETVRQLSNFETPQGKLMQIVLAGQPQLVKKLAAPEQEQLRQRISTISRLRPLSLNETAAYINHRLRTAGYRGTELFAPGAVRRIWESGKGVPRNINTLCFNAMLLGSAGNRKSIDETILEEAVSDLDMPSIMADMYRLEPSLVVSPRNGNGNGNIKVQAIREMKPAEPVKPENPVVAQGSVPHKVEITPAIPASGNGTNGGSGENIPLALIEAIVRISQTLEEQKLLLAAKSFPVSDPLPATTAAPATEVLKPPTLPSTVAVVANENPASSGQMPLSMSSAPCTSAGASVGTDKDVGREKSSPSKAQEIIPSQPILATVTASAQPAKIAEHARTLADSPIVRTQPGPKKPSKTRGFWLNALALVVITCLLGVVVVEKSSPTRAAELNSTEDSRSASAQNDSGSGYSIAKGPQGPMDAAIQASKATRTNSSAPRTSASDKFDDVTVRKFSAEPAASGTSTGAPNFNSIFFDQDSTEIAGRYRTALQQIADALAKDPEASVILEGHTDDSGTEGYNLDLSSRRATAVREALINDFNVPSTQLTAMGSGSAAPVQPNSSAAGRAYNRRVSVRFVRLGE
jgi:type II secretory pathway predicted ATPase ExeA/outer membrane protein OmpA-like peptidoglycan-associated protein